MISLISVFVSLVSMVVTKTMFGIIAYLIKKTRFLVGYDLEQRWVHSVTPKIDFVVVLA